MSGKYKIRASLVEVAEGKVRLRKDDGTVVSVPLDKLSTLDRRWLSRRGETGARGTPSPAAEKGDSAGDWPTFLGPNRDGKSPDTGLLKEWPEGGPPLLWQARDIGEGYSGVSVAGGAVYITGDAGGQLWLSALDLEGKPKWKIQHGPAWTGDWPGARATATVDGNRIYLFSGVGQLGCFDTATGRRLWVRDAKEFGGAPGNWGYAESALVSGDLVIFKPGGRNCIVALDKKSGRDVWASRGFEAGPEYSSCIAVEQDGGTAIVTGTKQGIVAVNARNGNLVWANPFAAGNVANCPTPLHADNHVFWANGYGKGGICLKLEGSGRASEAWTTGDMDCHHGGYIIDGDHIYGNHGAGWTCLDLQTGQQAWRERGVGKGSLCWADGMLYLFSEDRGRVALATCSPEGMEIKGEFQVEGDGKSWAHPVVIGGRLYLRYHTNLYCYDVRQK